MLPRSQRLTTKQFSQALETGKISHTDHFIVRRAKAEGKTRISAVVPVKVERTAVKRNAMRRAMYRAIAPLRNVIADGHHAIIFAKKSSMSLSYDQLSVAMKECFVKAGLLK